MDVMWQAQMKLPATGGSVCVFALPAGGVPLREQQAVLWTKAASGRKSGRPGRLENSKGAPTEFSAAAPIR